MKKFFLTLGLGGIALLTFFFIEGASVYQSNTALPMMVAVGKNTSLNSPLIVARDEHGNWSKAKITPITGFHAFGAISCTGSGARASCVAVGQTRQTSSFQPLLLLSKNAGNTWEKQTIDGSPSVGVFSDVSCVQSQNPHATCVIVGADLSSTVKSLIFVSNNNGTTWQATSNLIENDSELIYVTCTENAVTPICVATGLEQAGASTKPFLILSQDGGYNWRTPNIELPGSGEAGKPACSGQGDTAVCTVIVKDPTAYSVYVSQDGGSSWQITKKYYNSTVEESLSATDCTGDSSSTVCTVVGSYKSSSGWQPMLFVSHDRGTQWNEINGLNQGSLLSTSCTGLDKQMFCAATGANTSPIYVSNLGVTQWEAKTVPGLGLHYVKCLDNKGAASCIVLSNQETVFYVSDDQGKTWVTPDVPQLPESGYFSSASIIY